MQKKLLLVGLCSGLCGSLLFSLPAYSDNSNQSLSGNDRLSYSLGYTLGHNLGQSKVHINPRQIIDGFNDALKDKKPKISLAEQQKTLKEFQQKMMQQAKTENETKAKINTEAGEKFLAENAKKDGVVNLADGLQYKVIKEGSGPTPKATDTVTVNYEGSLIDGKVFDSSYKRGQPATFPLNHVIKGWTECLTTKDAKVGSTIMCYIPAKLGYGNQNIPGIPAGSTLVFKVEILSIGNK